MLLILQRIAAFAVDCGLLALYAGLLFLLVSSVVRPFFLHSALLAELTGFLLLTLPFGVYFIISETSSRRATLGKHLWRLQVVQVKNSKRITLRQSMIRTIVKLLPWELAHFAIWNAFIFPTSLNLVGIGALVACYVLMILYLIGLAMKPHRPLYDRLAGTIVVGQEKPQL